MSPSAVHADNRRISARVLLFMLVAVVLTLVLFSGGPTGAISFAQQQTTSPGPTIKWLNPDSETSNEISAKADRSGSPTGQTYHLVATVSQVPPNPTVVFSYRTSTTQPVKICDAQQVGDAFHCHWGASGTAPMPADGSYTLIALLSSNGQQLFQDTEQVVVNNTTEGVDPNQAQSETVEITDPVLGDLLGFYDRPGDPRYTAVIDVSYSEDTVELLPYYTTSAPGTEPDWVACESGAQSTDDSDDGVQCELASPTTPQQVTGVAVVAYDDPSAPAPAPGPQKESGDAHRVHGYEAIPTSFELAGAPTASIAPPSCSPVITATLLDQNGNPVGGANVDVHGQGPGDTLQFDDSDASGNNSSAHKPPENHPTQTARDCETTTDPPEDGSQGWHAETGNDRKHIESTDGTTDDGTFKFQFYSPVDGVTQYTIWSDDDGNDRLCSREAQKDGAIGWGEAPPTPTGVADEDSTCVRPGQSSTSASTAASTSASTAASTSASPTPTSTSTSPSPTSTSTSPSPTSTSTTASPTPTNTTTPPPDKPTPVASSVSGKATKKGFNGQVTAAKKRCEKRRLVKVKKAGKGVIGTDRTNKAGNWKLRRPNAKGRFHAVVTPKKFTNRNGQTFKCTKDRSPFFRRKG